MKRIFKILLLSIFLELFISSNSIAENKPQNNDNLSIGSSSKKELVEGNNKVSELNSNEEKEIKQTSRSEAPGSISNVLSDIDEIRSKELRFRWFEKFFDPWFNFTENLNQKYGLNIGLTYTVLYQHASKSLQERTKNASSGVFDILGEWHLLNRGKKNEGFLGFRTRWAHTPFTEIAPNNLNNEIGSLWKTASAFSDLDFFINQLWWEQNLWDDKINLRIGKVKQTDFVDFFRFSSSKLYYINAAFSQNPTIPFPEEGFGGYIKFQPTDLFYVLLTIGDNNAEADSFNFKSFFEKREYLTALEINFHPLLQKYGFEGNHHVTFWHSDGRKEKDTPPSRGISVNLDELFLDRYGAFIRYSYSDGKETNVKQLLSLGLGIKNLGLKGNIIAIAFAVGEPRQSNLRTQYVFESFYRIQLLSMLQVTPDIQFIINPSDNPGQDLIVVYGIRLRIAI